MEYLIRGKFVVTLDPAYGPQQGTIRDGAVFVSGREIVAVGRFKDLRPAYPTATVLGSSRYWVVPGFVNAHQHGKGLTQFQLGARDDCFEISRFTQAAMASVDPYLDILYACKRMIEGGITTCLHYNSSRGPESYEADLSQRLQAYHDAGLRVSFGLDVRDRNHIVYGDEEFLASLKPSLRAKVEDSWTRSRTADPEEYFRVAGKFADSVNDTDGRTRIFLTPAGPQWCTEDLLREIRRESSGRGLGVQIHVLETKYQRSYFLRRYGKSAVSWLADLDFFTPSVSLAHGVWLSREDMNIVARAGSPVVHNPSSNLRLRSGIAPLPLFHAAGVPLAMGLDSSPLNDEPDMFLEMRLAANLQRIPGVSSGLVPLPEIFKAATVNGATALGWETLTGTLTPGKRADIVLIDSRQVTEPYLASHQGPIDTLIYRAKASAVDTVVVDGEILYQGKKHVRLDARTLIQQIKKGIAPYRRGARNATDAQLLHAATEFYQAWENDDTTPFHRVNSVH